MADPTGTVGLPGSQEQSDLALATRGGPKFMARLQQLADAADRHEQAFAQLCLGQEAVAALKEAAEQREAAKIDRTAAAAELAKAKREAAEIRADADIEREAAQELRRNAEEQLRDVHEKEQRAIEVAEAARKAVARSDTARRQADAVEKKFTDKIDRLKDALSRV